MFSFACSSEHKTFLITSKTTKDLCELRDAPKQFDKTKVKV